MFLLTTCGLQISTSLLSIACDDVWEIFGGCGIQSIINIAKMTCQFKIPVCCANV